MRYFLDTEFYERPGLIDFISIGIVAEDGRAYYAENSLFDWTQHDPQGLQVTDTGRWLWENVRPHLGLGTHRRSPKFIGTEIREFVGEDPDPQFWAWYADYDWVVFCWLQGRMIDLPRHWPKYCRDLKQVFDQLGNPKAPDFATTEHHALADAVELKQRFDWARANYAGAYANIFA